MRAVVFPSSESDPVIDDFPDPEAPPRGETLELVGAGVHPVVRGLARGAHYGSTGVYPLVPGVDAVARRADGSLVYAASPRAPWGTMSERIATSIALPLPGGADPLAVAAGMNPGMSGWMPLTSHRDAHGSLGTVLVLGATGLSGGMAVHAARLFGADRIVAAGRDAASLDALRSAGFDTADLTDPDALARTVADGAPDLVLDYVWGPVAEAAFAALARHGLAGETAETSYVQIGSSAGAMAALPAAVLRSRPLRVSGSGAGSFSQDQLMRELPQMMSHISDDSLPVPYTTYPFRRVGEAWAHTGRSRAVVVPD